MNLRLMLWPSIELSAGEQEDNDRVESFNRAPPSLSQIPTFQTGISLNSPAVLTKMNKASTPRVR